MYGATHTCSPRVRPASRTPSEVLIGDHGNLCDREPIHDEVEMMGDDRIDDGGGDNNYLDNVEDLDDQGSDEMPRSGHRRGYHSKRGPCTIDDEEDDR